MATEFKTIEDNKTLVSIRDGIRDGIRDDSENLSEEDAFRIIKSYFASVSIVNNQLDHFNDLINFGLQDIIDQEPPISIPGYSVKFGHITVPPPQVIEEDRSLRDLYPCDARRRDLTYDSALLCDITETYIEDNEPKEKISRKVFIGRIPIMLKSEKCNLSRLNELELVERHECLNDPGGYFVIRGKERVLVSQVRGIYNQIFVLKQKNDNKYSYIAEVRSMSNETGHSVLLKAMLLRDDRKIFFSLPCINQPIPVGIVFKALGYNEEETQQFIGLTDPKCYKYLRYIRREAAFCTTKEEALRYIGQFPLKKTIPIEKKENYSWQIVETELLPHLGVSSTVKEIACFLGDMIRRLLDTAVGNRKVDDKDNFANKRIEVGGVLLYDLFRNVMKRYMSEIKSKLEQRKQRPDIISIISRLKTISKGLHHCLSTGNWTVQKNATYMRTGVSQVLDRMTYCSTLSHLRRVIIPAGKEGKNTDIRQIHGSSFGYICPCETPEGKHIGCVLNFCMSSEVTPRVPSIIIKQVIEEKCTDIISVSNMNVKNIKDYTYIFLNGVIIGFTQYPFTLVKQIKELKRKGLIHYQVSIRYNEIEREIRIFSDEGRFTRPLLVVDEENRLRVAKDLKSKKCFKWRKLIKEGKIEYLDPSEIEGTIVAMYPSILQKQNSNYCEIHPSLMLGIMASMIPFPDHNQSPRNCYQSSMGKQALGIPMLSYNVRSDTMLHVLMYPQRPLVYTKYADLLKINEMPSGINAIVAIACYTGYNQEDSVIMNQSSVDKGLFCLTTYHCIDNCERKRDTYTTEEICLPPETTADKKQGDEGYFKRKDHANYSLLDENGIIRTRDKFGKAITVKRGDVLIGKIVVVVSKLGERTCTDASVIVQPGDEGTIDKVTVSITPNGYKLVKIMIRNVRKPTLGDKVASRSSQKGTIGMLYRQEDMPFTASGITPDIIMNPLAIPSRMTVGQLIECVLGKECCITGEYGDATPFTMNSIDAANKLTEKICNELPKYGMQPHGWETMYNGFTGKQMKARIFMGPTYYQRLKHMVDDKMHARARGNLTNLTRQPLEGRAKDGGLRFGEMEKDCMIAHGGASLLEERLFRVSDPFQVPVCENCKVITASGGECQACKGNNVKSCNIPYASKLLFQELTAMGLKIAIKPGEY